MRSYTGKCLGLVLWRHRWGQIWWLVALSLLVATPLWAQQPGTWAPADDLNQTRAGHTATLLPDGKVLVAGGLDARGRALAASELYDPSTGQYAQMRASLPVAVWGHTATLLQDGTVLFAGGKDSAGQPVAALQLFDPATRRFTALHRMSTPRSQHTATLLKDGRVLIAGGTDGQGALPGLEIYDPGIQAAVLAPATLRTPRQNHTATLLYPGRVLIVGGSNSSGVLNSAETYNPDDGTIVPAGSLGVPRTLASAALLLDGSVLVAGGQDAQGQDLNSAEIYTPAANVFTPVTALMGAPRSGHVGLRLAHNGKVLFAGGRNAGQLVPSVEVYDPVTGTFWAVGSPETARDRFSANFFAAPYTGILMASGGEGRQRWNRQGNRLRSSELFFYPTVRTDKRDYQPGDTVTVMGERWLPNEKVTITIRESSGDPDTTLTTTTDESGFYSISQFQMNSLDRGVRFYVTATGERSRWTAQMSFTDSPLPIDPCANGALASPVPCAGTTDDQAATLTVEQQVIEGAGGGGPASDSTIQATDNSPGDTPCADGSCVALLIDEDSIDNGNEPNFFSDDDVNDQIADIGLRAQLPYFKNNVGKQITLYTGQVGDEGWFAPKTIPASWAAAGPTSDGLSNYVAAGPGLGTRNSKGDREALLDKIPDVTPLRATGLKMLEGKQVCAVVYDSDISINYGPLNGSLKGANLGTVAFKVLAVRQRLGGSSSSLPEVTVRILDAGTICQGPLGRLTDAPAPQSSSGPFDVVPEEEPIIVF